MKVGIVNYGMGNIGSAARALSLLDVEPGRA
jgi:imidazoleglycerol phosphate synthase glutamine amidotransferase subunit HisH